MVVLLKAPWVRLATSIVTITSNQLEQVHTLKYLVIRTWHLCCRNLQWFSFSLALIWSQGLDISGKNWAALGRDLQNIFWLSFKTKEFNLYIPKLLCDMSESMVNWNDDDNNACFKNTLLIKTKKLYPFFLYYSTLQGISVDSELNRNSTILVLLLDVGRKPNTLLFCSPLNGNNHYNCSLLLIPTSKIYQPLLGAHSKFLSIVDRGKESCMNLCVMTTDASRTG